MPFKPGQIANPKGRTKGVPNKTTAAVKEALSAAFDAIGGPKSFAKWARDNETEFYKLWVKMLPQDVNATVEATVRKIELVGVRSREG